MAKLPADPWRTKEEGGLFLGLILRLVDQLQRPLRAFGVDYPIFRELLRARVVMDLRPSGESTSGWGVAGIVVVLLVTWLMGMGTGVMALAQDDRLLWLVGSQSALFFLLLFYLVQALAGMLVDPTDVRVLAPHPVPDRTLFAVRLVQVFAYLFVLAASFTLGNVMLAVFRQPVLATLFVFPLLSLACTLTALGGVTLFLAVLLRVVGPAHFQRVSLWAQIGSAVVLMGGLQVAPRLVPEHLWQRLGENEFLRACWPPLQFARVYELTTGVVDRVHWIALAFTVALPALALLATLRLASRSYIAGLDGSLEFTRKHPRTWPQGLVTRLAARLTRSREQRAGFEFAVALSFREAHVLRATLPQFVSFQAMWIGLGVSLQRGLDSPSLYLCMSSGMVALVLPNLLEMCQGSPTPEARWIFVASPLESEAELVRGATKGLLAVWYGASLLSVLAVQLCFVGPGAILSVLLAAELSALIALGYARVWSLGVPFTHPAKKNSMDNVGLVLTMFLALGALGLLHWALSQHVLLLAGGVLAGAFGVRFLWRALERMPVSKSRRLDAAQAQSAT